MKYLLLGQVNKPIGLKGEVKIFSKTDFASTRYKIGNTVYYKDNDEYKPLIVNSFRQKPPFDIVSFKDYLDINLIDFLKGKEIFFPKDKAVLPKNYFFYSDLVGLEIIEENNSFGIVDAVMELPANLVLRIKYKDGYYDLPYVDIYIKKIDLENKKIEAENIDGLISDDN